MRVALLNGWCDKVLHKLCNAYEERSKLLVSILQTEPLIQIDTIPLGGYFIWITFTKKLSSSMPAPASASTSSTRSDDVEDKDNIYYYDATDVLKYCREHGQVNFLVGDRCDSFSTINEEEEKKSSNIWYTSELPADCCQYSARLCFADLDLKDLKDGAKTLVSAFQEYHKMNMSSK